MSNKRPLQYNEFDEILTIIHSSQIRALASVNRELIAMYWEIGKFVSEKTATDGWGKSTVSALASYLQSNIPSSTGFSERNIWRMKQFYETYKDKEKLSPLVAEIPWTNNLLIMTACKTDEAKEFYLKACIENHYSKRELERQIDSMLYERTAISDAKHGQLAKRNEGLTALRDAYVLEFLDLPASYKEKNLRKQIVSHLKDPYFKVEH